MGCHVTLGAGTTAKLNLLLRYKALSNVNGFGIASYS